MMSKKPFSVALVDDSETVRMAHNSDVGRWRRLIEPELYASHKEVQTALHRGRVHDIWVIDVDLGPGRPYEGIKVLKDVKNALPETSAWLYSGNPERLTPYLDGPVPVLEKRPEGEALWNLVCNEIAFIRGRWINEIRFPKEFNWDDHKSIVDVRGRGSMTIEQVFADLFIRSPAGARLSLKQAYEREVHGLLRYYRAFKFDPHASEEWNRDISDRGTRRSLLSALGHRLLRPGRGTIPDDAQKLIERVKNELRSFRLSEAVEHRVGELLDRQQPAVNTGGRWEWPGWKEVKLELTWNLCKQLVQIEHSAGGDIERLGFLKEPLPKDEDNAGWADFAAASGVCSDYWCDPAQMRAGFDALVRQAEANQKVIIDLKGVPIGDPRQRLLVATVHIDGMHLVDRARLLGAQGSSARGTGFAEVWKSLLGYGRCFVRSTSWDGWYEPDGSRAEPRVSYERGASGTTFVFELLAPYTLSRHGGEDDHE